MYILIGVMIIVHQLTIILIICTCKPTHGFWPVSGASNPVAMTAGLTQDVSLPNGGTVVFNKVFTNLGNGYDSTTGYFVAPTDGVFLIHYFARSKTGHVGICIRTWVN